MPLLELTVLSLRYSSWSMRAWLTLTHAGAAFSTTTIALPHMQKQGVAAGGAKTLVKLDSTALAERRALGSVHGLFPVLRVDGIPIHESLAICEYVADAFPDAHLWPGKRVTRARARAISCEMVSGFANLRSEMSCHLFGRVPAFTPSAAAKAEISRVFEIWTECLELSGGPFLFGKFGIADAMYYPVLTRFRTYGIPLAATIIDYARALETFAAVAELVSLASFEPRIAAYDDYLIELGGNPDAALPAK